LARNIGSSAGGFEGHTAQFKAEFFNSSSGEPLSMIGDFTFRDIDFIPSCGNSETLTGTGIEAVTAVADEILSYQISSDPVTDIAIEDSNDGTIKFANYETCGGPNDEQRWVSIRFHGKESLNLTFQARNANTGYGLSTSNFSKTPISFSQPNARNDETNTTQNTTHSGPRAVKVNQSGAYGSILIDNDGTYIYTLDRDNPDVKALSPGQTLEETFAYALSGPESKNPSATLTITITYDKLSPIVGGTIPPQSDLNGERINTLNAWAYLPDLPEPEGQSLTFSAANLPSGLSIDSSTGEITGILKINASQDAPEDIFSVEVTATNSNGGLVSTTFDWTITYPTSNVSDPLNDLPIVNTAIPDQAHFNSDTIRVNVSNNFGSAAGKPLTFEATGLPPGLSIEPSGTITGTIDQNASQNGSYIVVITADDRRR